MENEYEMTPKVSVIIPVWNPGEGVSRCVASLRGQTLGGIEMIFVDDCGTDGAMDVVRAAAAEDPRIRILTNAENMGPGASRNAGIEAARGEYLSFVDADDYADADFLELLYKKGRAEDLDIVKGSQIYINDDGIPAQKPYILNEGIRKGLSDNEPLFYLFCFEHQSAIYHRRLFAYPGVRYGLTGIGEDSTFLLKTCHAAQSFGMDDRACYRYVHREASAVNTVTAKSLDVRLSALKDKTEYLQSRVESNPYAVMYVARRLDYYLTLHSFVSRLPGMEEAASRFLSGLRELIGKYPGIQSFANQNFTVKALLDYGENLCEIPYQSPWGKPQPNDYLDVIVRRIGFLEKHPEHYAELSNTVQLSNWFVKCMRSDEVPKEEIAVFKIRIASLKRMPRMFWMRVKKKLYKLLSR